MDSMIPGLSGYVTTREAARTLGVTQNAVTQRIRRQRIHTLRVGRVILVKLADLTRTSTSTSASA